jgi:hypothetical protein
MYAENELLFPAKIIPRLHRSRGASWQTLVDQVADLPDDHPESLAFSLMMINLNGCLNCETDSYRAMRGCLACTQQTLRRYKGSDDELLESYQEAQRNLADRLHPQYIQLEFEPAPSAKAA